MRYCIAKEDFTNPDDKLCLHYYSFGNFEMHTHDYWEIFIVTDGMVFHEINGVKMSLQRGDCFLIRPQDAHCFHSQQGIFTRHLNIMIESNFLKNMLESIEPGLYDLFRNRAPYVFWRFSPEEYKRCADLIERFYFSDKDLYDNLMVKFFIIDIIILLYYHIFENADADSSLPEWLTILRSRARSPEFIGGNVEDLLKDIPYSHVHLNRLFKEYTGTTITNYFTEVKLEYACALLLTTNLTVLAISEQIGYASLSHFNRIFKRKYNQSPTAIRKNKRLFCKYHAREAINCSTGKPSDVKSDI